MGALACHREHTVQTNRIYKNHMKVSDYSTVVRSLLIRYETKTFIRFWHVYSQMTITSDCLDAHVFHINFLIMCNKTTANTSSTYPSYCLQNTGVVASCWHYFGNSIPQRNWELGWSVWDLTCVLSLLVKERNVLIKQTNYYVIFSLLQRRKKSLWLIHDDWLNYW